MKNSFLIFLSVLIFGTFTLSSAFATDYTQICVDKVWIESSNGRIACVTPTTADKLVERGWGISARGI